MQYTIRPANHSDSDAILSLLPRLADFDIPKTRNPDHLWQGDAEMLNAWKSEDRQDMGVFVAVSDDEEIVGSSIVTLREELLSHEPSAHLEVLVLAKSAEGHGLGKRLIAAAEEFAITHNAQSITLHVFRANARARALYEKSGYAPELMRYIKPL